VLVSPPHICVRITELLADPQSTARAIGEVIGQDPGLTARLLRLVNSPFYGFRARVDTVSRAVALVGQNAVHNLAVAVSVVRSFSDIPNELVNMDTFWRHGVYCGLIAKDCAARVGILHPERLFVAGLLHDLGSLLLYQGCPDASREALLVANGDEGVLYQAEVETFGFSHAELGGRLMTRWGLPEALADAVACHHLPAAARVAAMEAATLHVAEALANRSRIGAFAEQGSGEAAIDGAAWETLGVADPDALGADLIRQAGEHFLETVSLVCSRSRAAATPRAAGLRRNRR
jgi:HD-like signal output (HDOD) protein